MNAWRNDEYINRQVIVTIGDRTKMRLLRSARSDKKFWLEEKYTI